MIDTYMRKNVQLGNDQEKVQSERNSHSKNRGGKTQFDKVLIHVLRKTYCKSSEQLFPNRRTLSYRT